MEVWLNASLKSTETMDELSTTCNLKKLCQDARQGIQALDTKRPVASLAKGDLLDNMPSPFYSASVVLYQLQAPHLRIILNTWILTTKTILLLAVCS